jgi:hypothetical protein
MTDEKTSIESCLECKEQCCYAGMTVEEIEYYDFEAKFCHSIRRASMAKAVKEVLNDQE